MDVETVSVPRRCEMYAYLVPDPVRRALTLVLLSAVILATSLPLSAQSGHTLFGDIRTDESGADGHAPLTLDLILYNLAGIVVSRSRVSTHSRYRFLGLRSGEYDLVVEFENLEIARIRVTLGGGTPTDFRQDLEFEWKGGRPGANVARRKQTVSASEFYERRASNKSLFEKGQAAVDRKKLDEAVTLFRQLLEQDPQDFQAWTELGTSLLLQDKPDDAEKAYVKAVAVKPDFALALMNLGRVRAAQKKFKESIEPLTRLVELDSKSAEAHYLLGESYLQLKMGSKAVGYLTEAARLGRAEAHLRLGTLYNAVGMKDKAAFEYEEFLKKKPDHPERKKLEQYISANKK